MARGADRGGADGIVDVTVTCGSVDEARVIMRAAVDARLAACAKTWPVASTYRWQGEVHTDDEHLVVLTTMAERFDDLCACIRGLHSYELPAIAMVPVDAVGPGVAEWINGSIGDIG